MNLRAHRRSSVPLHRRATESRKSHSRRDRPIAEFHAIQLKLADMATEVQAARLERFYRDAPLTAIGEGTNDILRTVIARQLVRGSIS